VCPRVQAIEYYPDGAIRRVEFRPPAAEEDAEEDYALAEAGLEDYAAGLEEEDAGDLEVTIPDEIPW